MIPVVHMISVLSLVVLSGCGCPATQFQPSLERRETSGAVIGGRAGSISHRPDGSLKTGEGTQYEQ